MEIYDSPSAILFSADSTIIRGQGAEPRHNPIFRPTKTTIEVLDQDIDKFSYKVGNAVFDANLRSRNDLLSLINNCTGELYVDITSLSHHIWASIIRTALANSIVIRAIYIEPEQYVQSSENADGQIFDLSDRIAGIQAVPGFASFSDPFEEGFCFIPMLGFEGRRFAHMLEHTQPKGGKVFPIVGLPGFRLEYPFYTFHNNARLLRENQSWRNVSYAAANNPFSLFNALESIAQRHPNELLKIAPIGTKPHALGAFLYPLKTRKNVEFIYDFPIRSKNRTVGVGKAFLYRLSEFMI